MWRTFRIMETLLASVRGNGIVGSVLSMFRENGRDRQLEDITSTSLHEPQPDETYTVFISHAGEDKTTIAFPLRDKLRAHGISAFVDKKDMDVGADAEKDMINAMETAAIAVFVLSPEFVARKWPMKELMCFLTRRRERPSHDQGPPIIIPFFYRLTVSELYTEPQMDRLGSDGLSLYQESRFLERLSRKEPEADTQKIRKALRSLHGIMGVENKQKVDNEDSTDMYQRRDVLLNTLCENVSKAARKLMAQRFSNATQSDKFHKCFPSFPATQLGEFDFDRLDAGLPATTEGWIKHNILEKDMDSHCVSAVLGIGGVGKSTVVRALATDKEVQRHFPDGVHVIELGMDTNKRTLFEQVCRILKDSGAIHTEKNLRIRSKIEEALHCFGTWFEGKKCAFLIDDLWGHSTGMELVSQLCRFDNMDNHVLVTTREHEVASLAPSRRIVRLNPRKVRGMQSRQILLFHAEVDKHDAEKELSDIYRIRVLNGILDMCAGLPLALAAVGKAVKKIRMDLDEENREMAWKHYLSQLIGCRQRLWSKNVGSYEDLSATFATSIEILEENRQKKKEFSEIRLSFAEMFQRLSVLPKRTSVPYETLQHLWDLDNEAQAKMIATEFIEMGLACIEVEQRDGDKALHMSIPDSVYEFASDEARESGRTQSIHDGLLERYATSHTKQISTPDGSIKWWSSQLESDGYLHRNLCRHLLFAGRGAELVDLLKKPEWVQRQLDFNDILALEADFSFAIDALQSGMADDIVKDRFEVEKTLLLIRGAASLASVVVAQNPGELWFQLHGRLIALARRFEDIREYLYQIENGEKPPILSESCFLAQPGGPITRIIFLGAPVLCMVLIDDGMRFACGCKNGRIFIVNVMRSQIESDWQAHDTSIQTLKLGMDGQELVSRSKDGSIKVWEAETGRCVATFNRKNNFTCLAVLKDGNRVIFGSKTGELYKWNIGKDVTLRSSAATEKATSNVECLLDGEGLVSTEVDLSLMRFWKLTNDIEPIGVYTGHRKQIRCITNHPNGRYLLTGSDDMTVRIVDVLSHEDYGNPLRGHDDSVTSVAISADGKRIISGSKDTTIRIWHAKSRREVCYPLEGHKDTVTGVAFLEGTNSVISCSEDSTLRVWDVLKEKTQVAEDGHQDKVTCVSFTPDGTRVVSGSMDRTVRVWDVISKKQIGDPLRVHDSGVCGLAVTSDERVLFVSSDRKLHVWVLGTKDLSRTFRGHKATIWCVAWTPKGDRAITGSEDCTVRVWDLQGQENSHKVLKGHISPVKRVFVTDDGSLAVSVDQADGIFVWDLATGRHVKRIEKSEYEQAWRLSRRRILEIAGRPTEQDDGRLSLLLGGREIVHYRPPEEKVLATFETAIEDWAISPTGGRICIGQGNGQLAFMKVNIPERRPSDIENVKRENSTAGTKGATSTSQSGGAASTLTIMGESSNPQDRAVPSNTKERRVGLRKEDRKTAGSWGVLM